MWTEFGHSLDIVVSLGIPALKYTKIWCSQKNILGLLFVTVQTGLLYNEQISRYVFLFGFMSSEHSVLPQDSKLRFELPSRSSLSRLQRQPECAVYTGLLSAT